MDTHPVAYRVSALSLVVAVWTIGGPIDAAAQPVSSFSELQALVKPGDAIVVTDAGGNTTRGKVGELTASSLQLLNDAVLDFSESDVLAVRQRRRDSVVNGTMKGAIFGAVVILGMMPAACSTVGCSAGEVVGIAGIFAGAGAAIGAAVDAVIIPTQTIYEAPSGRITSGVQVLPMLGATRRGMSVRWSF